MVLKVQSKLYKATTSKTMYITLPEKLTTDSTFAFKSGDYVLLEYYAEFQKLVIRKKSDARIRAEELMNNVL
jgi:hypothetical protein